MVDGNGRELSNSDDLPDGTMRSYEHGPVSLNTDLSMGKMGFRTFDVEEVLKSGKPTGEYHIKPKVDSTIKAAMIFFRDHMPGFKVGAASVDDVIKLEYPIYAIAGEMAMGTLEHMPDMFKRMDDYLYEHRAGKKA